MFCAVAGAKPANFLPLMLKVRKQGSHSPNTEQNRAQRMGLAAPGGHRASDRPRVEKATLGLAGSLSDPHKCIWGQGVETLGFL